MRSVELILAAIACLISRGLFAQAQSAAVNPVGVWRGTSLCQVRPSACHDEIVVYYITHAKSGDSLFVDGRKVVNGKELEMGVLGCRYSASTAQLTCTIPSGIWRFAVRGDSLVGDLKSPDGVKFREVRTKRTRQLMRD
jgi:hypothetical protein